MKKKIITLLLGWLLPISFFAQGYHGQRKSHFEALSIGKKDIIFLGNSITDGCEWAELLHNKRVKNRGISGDTTEGILARLTTITQGQPAKLFLLIGINDLSRGAPSETIVANTHRIITRIKQESPRTKIYIQSLLPLSNQLNAGFEAHISRREQVPVINNGLQQIATQEGVTYIDLYTAFIDGQGMLRKEFTNDGLHLLGAGYTRWATLLKPYL